jgi:hypothetical protein
MEPVTLEQIGRLHLAAKDVDEQIQKLHDQRTEALRALIAAECAYRAQQEAAAK